MKNKHTPKLPTVTVGVSAFNEAANMKEFLSSVLSQKEDGFKLKQVIVISDGSTDETVKIAKSFKSKKLKVVRGTKRIGKSSRLNEIYQSLDSNYLVQTDADVIFGHTLVIKHLIKPMIQNHNVGMCAGNPQPVSGGSFTSKADSKTFKVYQEILKSMKTGHNVFSADGRLLAYRSNLVKKIVVPKDMIANDVFTYYCCLTQGWLYRYVPKAIIYFQTPKTLEDKIKQNVRSAAVPKRMTNYFSSAMVARENEVPLLVRINSVTRQFLSHPIESVYIYIINSYCQVIGRLREAKMTAEWEIATTTKQFAR